MTTVLTAPSSFVAETQQAPAMRVEVFTPLAFAAALTVLAVAMITGAIFLGSTATLLLAILPLTAACFLGSFAAIRSCF